MGKPKSAGPAIKTEIREVDPRTLKPRDKNARFMTAQQMKRLTQNVAKDGRLTSLPLVYQRGDALEIVSGHHRVQAAIGAGLASIEVIVIVTPLDEERLTALQLSHNAITGQDDRSILADLYGALDLESRKYSGLTDDSFAGLDSLGLSALGIGAVKYEELRLSFLPEDREEFLGFLKRIEGYAKTREVLVARYEEFDRFFQTLIAVKDGLKVQNAAIALALMAELALERLKEMESDGNAERNAEGTAQAAEAKADTDHKPGGSRASRKRRDPVARSPKAQG